MHNNAPARRTSLLSLLLVTCVLGLGGCSVLDGFSPFAPKSDNATSQSAPTEEALSEQRAVPEAGESEPSPPEAGTWNLATLKSMANAPEQQVLTWERAWRLTVENDPDYRAAMSARAAAQTEIRIGRAALLPQIQAGYSKSKITGLQRNFVPTGVREGELNYDSKSMYVQLRQPVFNVDSYAQYRGGKARAELGEAEFAVKEYEAAMRLVEAYVDAVAAQGRKQLHEALVESLKEQAATQEALFELNEASRVDAQETLARLALAEADLIAANDELEVTRRRLRGVIGEEPPPLLDVDSLEPVALGPQQEQGLIQWLERAQRTGPAVRAADARVRVADTEVTRAVARHTPTADLVIAYIDADSENLDTLSQRSDTFQLGLQVAIPLYSGGYDTANHARTRHERRQAEHELTQAKEQTAAEVTRHYTAMQGGAQRIEALVSSVQAGEESLEAARKGYEFGVNSNLDVLRRQDTLYQARFQLLEARIAWLEAVCALAATVGEPISPLFVHLDAILNR